MKSRISKRRAFSLSFLTPKLTQNLKDQIEQKKRDVHKTSFKIQFSKITVDL